MASGIMQSQEAWWGGIDGENAGSIWATKKRAHFCTLSFLLSSGF